MPEMVRDHVTPETREVYFTDRHAVARNVAMNGRLFCTLLFFACIVAFLRGGSGLFLALAIGAALPIGLSCVIDQLPPTRPRAVATIATYALAGAVCILFLISIR